MLCVCVYVCLPCSAVAATFDLRRCWHRWARWLGAFYYLILRRILHNEEQHRRMLTVLLRRNLGLNTLQHALTHTSRTPDGTGFPGGGGKLFGQTAQYRCAKESRARMPRQRETRNTTELADDSEQLIGNLEMVFLSSFWVAETRTHSHKLCMRRQQQRNHMER